MVWQVIKNWLFAILRSQIRLQTSERAIQVNIEIMRAFVKLMQILSSDKDLAKKLESLEKKYDGPFKIVFDVIRALMKPDPKGLRK